MNPPITKEGNTAAGRIAEFRQNVNNGATAKEARANLAAVTAGPKAPTPLTPTVSANALTTPTTPVSVPTPAIVPPPAPSPLVGPVAKQTDTIIAANTAESKRLQELRDSYGLLNNAPSLSDMFTQQKQDLGVNANLKELQDIQLRLTDMNTASDLTKTRIEGADGQTMGQAQREVTQQDRENAVRTTGLAARAAVLQGNIETATALAKDTVDIAFKDRTVKAQNLINQINDLRSTVDDQTAQLLEQDKRKYEAELASIKELKDNIATAMVNGASQSEITQLNDPALDDASKLALAQSITARGANQMRNLEMGQKSASIRASNASAALNEAELIATQKAQQDAANGILTPEQMKTANDVNKDFEGQPIVKSYNEGLQKYIVLEDTLSNGIDGVQDLQLVYDFMKSVDPSSVVREQEFANAAKTGNIFQGAYAGFNKAFGTGGFLPENVKQDFIRAARSSFEAKNVQYFNVKSEYAKRMSSTVGVPNGADYLTSYEAAAPITEADNNIIFGLSGASEQDIQDIMLMTEQMMGGGTQGANIYK